MPASVGTQQAWSRRDVGWIARGKEPAGRLQIVTRRPLGEELQKKKEKKKEESLTRGIAACRRGIRA